MGKTIGASSTNKIKKAPKVKTIGKTKQFDTKNGKAVSGAGLPSPKVPSLRGYKGDERQ